MSGKTLDSCFAIHRHEKTGILFLYKYQGISRRLTGQKAAHCEAYNFKQFNHHTSSFKHVVDGLKKITGADISVGIPNHQRDTENNISKICDQLIFSRSKTRPTRHNDNYAITVPKELATIRIEKEALAGQKILLCDDIATTGQTMAVYRQVIRENQGEVVACFSIGHARQTKKCQPQHVVCLIDKYDAADDLDKLLLAMIL